MVRWERWRLAKVNVVVAATTMSANSINNCAVVLLWAKLPLGIDTFFSVKVINLISYLYRKKMQTFKLAKRKKIGKFSILVFALVYREEESWQLFVNI